MNITSTENVSDIYTKAGATVNQWLLVKQINKWKLGSMPTEICVTH